MPESPRFLMHKGKTLEAYKVWRRIRGVESIESKEEFFVMKASVEEEEGEVAQKATGRFPVSIRELFVFHPPLMLCLHSVSSPVFRLFQILSISECFSRFCSRNILK
jgi:Sugar (and other) transporter